MKTPSQLEADLFRWMLNHNLNHIVLFHNGLQALLREKLNTLRNEMLNGLTAQ